MPSAQAADQEALTTSFAQNSALKWYDDYIGGFPARFATATENRGTITFAVGNGDLAFGSLLPHFLLSV